MSVIDHPNYSEEKDRLKYTIDYVEASIIATNKNRKKYKADMREAFLDLDPTDSSLSYVKIMTNAKFLDNLDKNYDGLIRSRKNPYFCRIDFQIEGNSEKSKLYIGKMSLAKAEDNSLIIIDWRSPIATVYYDGRLGSVSYKSPEGFTRGELFLKRQYSIKHRNLDSIMDVDITTNDIFLQKALGENKDNKLKDIVSTIQSEQNVIIRSEIDNPIIVQGAAGSGKTTIALHRIAYLIYTYEKTFYPDNFLIIAPNNLFLDYISGVLPDLGVDKVIQSTFEKLVFDLTGTKYKVINPDEKLIKIIENKTDIEEINVIKKISKYKGSLEYIKLIDTFITNVLKDFIPKEDFIVENYTIYTYSEMNSIFLEDFKYLPVYERLPELKKVISNRFKLQKKIILKEIERKYDSQIDTIRMNLKNSEEKRNKLVYLMDERDNKLASFKKASRTAIRKFFDKFKKREIDSYYVDFIKSIKNANIDNNEYKDIINDLVKKSIDNISKNQLEYEDLTPILYLKYKVFSLDKNLDIKYIVVDEAQDFSPLQIYILKKIFRTELFTLLGDISQGIHSYRGINSWSEIFDQVFQSKFKKFLTLEQSYRTTVEIMNTASEIISKANIPQVVLAKPVVRHGDLPRVFDFKTKESLISKIENRVKELLSDNFQTIAIICKTNIECLELKKLIEKRKNITVNYLKGNDSKYDGGVVLIPAYLAKGLEFDAVILTLYKEFFKDSELDLKLLYVSMTRALHVLDIFKLNKDDKIINSLKKINFIKF